MKNVSNPDARIPAKIFVFILIINLSTFPTSRTHTSKHLYADIEYFWEVDMSCGVTCYTPKLTCYTMSKTDGGFVKQNNWGMILKRLY